MAGVLPPAAESLPLGLAAALHAVAERSVFGERAADFHAVADAAALRAWTRRAGTAPAVALRAIVDHAARLGASDVALLASGTPDALAAAVLAPLAADPGFARAPHWDGEARETGALARMADHPALVDWRTREGHGVAARLFARLVELAVMLDALATQEPLASWSPRAGTGIATVETARGLLLHRAEVGNGRVTRYAIVAPTEWNFHPHGPLARGLAQLPADDDAELERAAQLVVRSLDPCVACRVEIGHA
jgi:hypothetical protein